MTTPPRPYRYPLPGWPRRLPMHVIPVDDLRPHIASADCWCSPVREPDVPVYVHQAADGRDKEKH